MPLPTLTHAERLAALEKAAETRRARAEVKEQLKSGRTTLSKVLDAAETDDMLGKLRVLALLQALPGYGRVRAQQLMDKLKISTSRRLRGLGNHTDSMIALMRLVSQAVSVVITGTLLWKAFRGRIKAVNGLGAGLGAVLVLGPVLQPWYVLWAALPLATAVLAKRFRLIAMSASA